ncbi:hypothetical protein Hanom_Chr13g01212291 [Helianthus anomalus]
MGQVIAWRVDTSKGRFVLKFSERRMVKVKTMKAILSMDVAVKKDILALWVPMAKHCERAKTIIRRLKRRFTADDDDVVFDLPTVTGWSLDEQSRMVKVTYHNREEDSLTMDEVLNIDRLHLLEQLCDLAPSHVATSRIVIILKYRMQDR